MDGMQVELLKQIRDMLRDVLRLLQLNARHT